MNNSESCHDYTTYATKTYEERCIEMKHSMEPHNHPPFNDRLQNTSGRLQPVGMQFLKRCYYSGLDLIPLKGFSKRPEAMEWQKKPRMTAEETKATFKDGKCNVGIRTGRLSGVIVVDADNPQSVEWCETMLPTTQFTTITGKRTDATPHGGKHYYYRHPKQAVKSCDIKIDEAEDIKVEIKSDGKQVVAPYSIHPDSQVEYRCKGDWSDIAALPIFDMRWFPKTTGNAPPLVSLPPETLQSPVSNSPTIDAKPPVSIKETSTGAWYKDMGHTVEEGQRNKTLFTAACDYKATGQPLNKAILDLLPEAIDGGLPQHEALQTIRSAYGNPRTATKRTEPQTETQKVLGLGDVDAAELGNTNTKPVAGIWGDVIVKKQLLLFVGQEKSGKTTFLHSLFGRFFADESEFIYEIRKEKVFICTEENGDLYERYYDIYEWGQGNVFYLGCKHFLDVNAAKDPVKFRQLIRALGERCKYREAGVIVFDTFRKLFGLDSYDDASQIKKVLDPVKSILCDEFELAVIIVHHMKKNVKENEGVMAYSSGSTMLGSECDVCMLLKNGADNERHLHIRGRMIQPVDFDVVFDPMDHTYTYAPKGDFEEYRTVNHRVWGFIPNEWIIGSEIIERCRGAGITRSTTYRALQLGVIDEYLAVSKGKCEGHSRNVKRWRRTDKEIKDLVETINGGTTNSDNVDSNMWDDSAKW